MMKNKIILPIIAALAIFCNNVLAEDKTPEAVKHETPSAEIQKVVDEFKHYVSSISDDTREEIVGYRKENAQLNKKKRELYNKLSQGAQAYLKKEREYRAKIPTGQKKALSDHVINGKE